MQPWARRHEAVANADLALVATGAPDPILTAPALPPAQEGSTLVVDVTMPRNVDPAVADESGYRLYDLDDLEDWTDAVQEKRARAVPEAESICEELLEEFVTWVFHQQALQPAIQAIRSTFDTIREQEVERHAHRTDMDREEVDRLTESIMQKLLAVPIVRLKNVDPGSIDFVQGIELLRALFAPSDEAGTGRSLSDGDDAERPDLGDAPSRCPYLTHDSAPDDPETEDVQRALRMTEGHTSSDREKTPSEAD
jgi:glutamyl-tRNA reductase